MIHTSTAGRTTDIPARETADPHPKTKPLDNPLPTVTVDEEWGPRLPASVSTPRLRRSAQ
ncbi:hypothetical protein GCM10010921_18140 [Microbacterium album]|uniref:Uncharacterized protein n=1 Tax=Microbacterium album TaxID=2053191 RepID=A0A917IE65_9MICO|nr:hypothetical protein GCM10010921_18140 [Microbacterium album]